MDGTGVKRADRRTIGAATGRTTSILAIPYGYTVTLWSAGALAFVRLGSPGMAEVFLFVLGACGAFVILAALGAAHLDPEVPMRVPAVVVFNGFPILAALAVAVVPLPALGRAFGFVAASFVATATYVLSVAVLVRLASRRAADTRL